jgi:hypothetical protein
MMGNLLAEMKLIKAIHHNDLVWQSQTLLKRNPQD